jgi:hypothetical protein
MRFPVRLKARIDANQPAVVKAFRDLGYIVAHTHQLGSGFPDIVISKLLPSKHRFTACIEIKDGRKPKSSQKLTPDEQEWHKAWQGELAIITSIDDVLVFHDYVMREFG